MDELGEEGNIERTGVGKIVCKRVMQRKRGEEEDRRTEERSTTKVSCKDPPLRKATTTELGPC